MSSHSTSTSPHWLQRPGGRALAAAQLTMPSKKLVAAFVVFAAVVVGYAATLGPVPGAGAVAAMGITAVVLLRPATGAYMLVALAPALSGIRRGLPVPGFRLSELMIVGLGTIILVTARKTPRWGVFDLMAMMYVVATAILVWANVVRHEGTFTPDVMGTLFGPLQFFILYRAILVALPTPEQRSRAIRLMLFVSVPVALLTLMQQFDVPGIRALLNNLTGTSIYETTVGQVPRATGPFPHWHNLGGYMLLIVLLAASVALEPAQRIISKRALFVVVILALAALVQTASFAPLIATVVGGILIGVATGQGRRVLRWLAVVGVAGAIVFGPLIVSRFDQQYEKTTITQNQSLAPQTIAFRWEVWTTQFLPVIKDNLLTGYGPTLPPRLYFDYAESLYVTFLLRGGVVLVLVYLGLMAALAARARRISRFGDQEGQIVGRVVFAAVPLLLVIDTIATYFLDSGPAPSLWTLAGLMGVDAFARSRRRSRAAASGRLQIVRPKEPRNG